MTTELDAQQRLRRLEDLEAIRGLKAHYFSCCDAKDPQGMSDCFLPGRVDIDYGAIGRFDRREALAEVFERLGCHPHLAEMHHGVNPRIELTGEDHARGDWGLHYQQIDLKENRLTQLGARYEDEYRRHEGRWLISATRCIVTSTLVLDLSNAGAKALHMAGAAAAQEAAQ